MHTPVVLIVEDEKPIRDQFARMALHAGCRPVAVEDGEQALVALENETPDLVVTDLHMPRLGGRHLIALIRQIPRLADTPIMVVTADGRRNTKIDLLETGADEFISKPVDPEEFTARIRALVRRSESVTQLDRVSYELDLVLEDMDDRLQELERLLVELLSALERDAPQHDGSVANHIRRIGRYSAMIADSYGCSSEIVEAMARYGGLHDVGKIRVRTGLLEASHALGPAELAELEAHTHLGADLLRAAGLPETAVNIALHHHERWDGTGYPHRLAGAAIPLAARIVAVADAFDALVSERGYRRSFSFDEARVELLRVSGTQLDPELVTVLLAQQDQIIEISSSFVDPPVAQDIWA